MRRGLARGGFSIGVVPMPRDDKFSGLEFDWLGVDQNGYVAAFISWGGRPLPAGVARHLDEVDVAMKRI